MFRGILEAIKIIKKGMKFLVYFDPDVDGLMAGYMCCRFLTMLGIPFEFYVNENRKHGFFLDPKSLVGYTILASDFALGDDEVVVLKELVDNGVSIVCIDHHDITHNELVAYENSQNGCAGVIINNHYSFEPKEYRFYSGAGVVYECLKAMMPAYACEEVEALIGITLLSDSREIENARANELLRMTYDCTCPLMQDLIRLTANERDFNFGAPVMDRNFIDYTFSPKINALFRLNCGETAVRLILGLEERKVDFDAFRAEQNRLIDVLMATGTDTEFSNLIVRAIDIEDIVTTEAYDIGNFIGVVASRIMTCGKTVLIYLYSNETILRGSVRGKNGNISYLNIFKEFGFVCKGHENAFGVKQFPVLSSENAELNSLYACLSAINDRIKAMEEINQENTNAIREVTDLSTWNMLNNVKVAMANALCREKYRTYLKYTGKRYHVEQRGKMFLYIIDGIPVKCFDEKITPENGYILPVQEKGYQAYYLRGRVY